jgi:hypothetical protein
MMKKRFGKLVVATSSDNPPLDITFKKQAPNIGKVTFNEVQMVLLLNKIHKLPLNI